MFQNHMLQEFELPDGKTTLEELYGFSVIPNDHVLVNEGSAATGFDCGVPPEPSVSLQLKLHCTLSILHKLCR